MLVANDIAGNREIAWNTTKDKGPFSCPQCLAEVVLKKGEIKVHHFAHKPPFDCAYGSGETQKHLTVKRAIYEDLLGQPNCTKCELERSLNGVRPDVSLYINGKPVAIEIQRSDIDIEIITQRALRYSKLGIYLIWVMPDNEPVSEYDPDENTYTCRPKIWQKFLHSMYFGRLYYWQDGATVEPIHLSKYQYWVPESNWVEDYCAEIGEDLSGTNWYEENYYEAGYGGYQKTAKVEKLIEWAPLGSRRLHIARDFRPISRSGFETKNWTVPASKIWADSLSKWWQ